MPTINEVVQNWADANTGRSYIPRADQTVREMDDGRISPAALEQLREYMQRSREAAAELTSVSSHATNMWEAGINSYGRMPRGLPYLMDESVPPNRIAMVNLPLRTPFDGIPGEIRVTTLPNSDDLDHSTTTDHITQRIVDPAADARLIREQDIERRREDERRQDMTDAEFRSALANARSTQEIHDAYDRLYGPNPSLARRQNQMVYGDGQGVRPTWSNAPDLDHPPYGPEGTAIANAIMGRTNPVMQGADYVDQIEYSGGQPVGLPDRPDHYRVRAGRCTCGFSSLFTADMDAHVDSNGMINQPLLPVL